ncbi:MAG: cell division protein ZipA C-terminal FtsZ-binding domain-containing protein [Gammaproteobacteria bacterium]|uniref:Cell division protein ZipA n=1 Tax=SAR86 cluster bacterium TaxID=2030880 RepID=A0A838YWF0_9GAMM|nr:cell division protein ZipA [SAR86 cluster bacterium]
MQSNVEIYLIGLSVLVFLILVFILIKKISSNGELKVKIEPVIDDIDNDVDMNAKSQKSFDFEAPAHDEENNDEELAILNLISIDKTNFDIEQLFAFMANCNAQVRHGFFILKNTEGKELFRVANALSPGIFDDSTNTFAVVIATNLSKVDDPPSTFREMLNFAYSFSEKFYANICDEERMPITKQMISHIESKAQEIMRLKQLKELG